MSYDADATPTHSPAPHLARRILIVGGVVIVIAARRKRPTASVALTPDEQRALDELQS